MTCPDSNLLRYRMRARRPSVAARALSVVALLLALSCLIAVSEPASARASSTPPGRLLAGSASIAPARTTTPPGTLVAFALPRASAGTAGAGALFLDAGSRARTVRFGLYSDVAGGPSVRLAQATLANAVKGAWITVALPRLMLRRGTVYWAALLGVDGAISVRAQGTGRCRAQVGVAGHVTAIPARWPRSRAHAVGCAPSIGIYDVTPQPSTIVSPAGPGSSTSLSPTGPGSSTTVPPAGPGPTELPPGPLDAVPQNLTAPSLTGTAQEGETLGSSVGSWTGDPTSYRFAWTRGGARIVGATEALYTLTAADVGARVAVTITAYNAAGSSAASSAPSAIVLARPPDPPPPVPPVNSEPPTIAGQPLQGSELTALDGVWFGDPTGFAYQWLRDGVAIDAATQQIYVPDGVDVGHQLAVTVTATNDGGSESSTSAATAAVTVPLPSPPVNVVPPSISGAAVSGGSLSAVPGTWTGSPTRVSYQWSRDGSPIDGATQQTYLLSDADVGATIKVTETATNAGGSRSVTTVPSAVVSGVGSGNEVAQCTTNSLVGASPGDVVCLPAGSYGDLTLSVDDLTLQPAPGASVSVHSVTVTADADSIVELTIDNGVLVNAGANGTVIAHDAITGGFYGIELRSINCDSPNAPAGQGCVSLAPIAHTTITANRLYGAYLAGAIEATNWSALTVTDNEIGGLQEAGHHSSVFASLWGGSNLLFSHNYIHDYCARALDLIDGDISSVTITDNLWARSTGCAAAPSGWSSRLYGTTGLLMTHNTFAGDSGEHDLQWFRYPPDAGLVTDNVLAGIAYPDGLYGSLGECFNVLQSQPADYSTGTDSVIWTPGWVNAAADDYRIVGVRLADGEVPGIDWAPHGFTYGP